MKKYGDDADLVHDQGTRVEASKSGYKQNRVNYNSSYRSSSNPTYTYKPKTSNKSTYKPDYSKTYYKPNYSKKTNQQRKRKQSKSTSYKSYNNQKRKTYKAISVEEANKRLKQQKKKSTYTSSDGDNIIKAALCLSAILAFAISLAIDNPIAFPPLLIAIFSIFAIIIFVMEKIFEILTIIIKSFKNKLFNRKSNNLKKTQNSNIKIKRCPKCNLTLNVTAKKCFRCGHRFKLF